MRNPCWQAIVTTALAGVLFLAPWSLPAAHAQDNKDAEIKQLKETIDRQHKEIELLEKVIRSRDNAIVRLEADLKKHRDDALKSEASANASRDRAEALLQPIRELTKALAGKEAGRVVIRKPNEPNPPDVKMEGKVLKVDGSLVQISLGADHGLKEHHTLHVYRLEPEPKYLGMIRITDAYGKTSVGRLLPSKTGKRETLKVGDRVTSKFGAKGKSKKKADPPNGNDFPFDLAKPNPPRVLLEGKITKVDAGLVEINIGSDNGLKVNSTLDVYRLKPQPTYLGMIRITSINNTTSVGRLVPSGTKAVRPPTLKEGDQVTSKIK